MTDVPTETKPGRSRTVKLVLLVALTAILATVITLFVQYNNRVDALTVVACQYRTEGETWENVKAAIGDDSLAVRVQMGMIEKCPYVAFEG